MGFGLCGCLCVCVERFSRGRKRKIIDRKIRSSTRVEVNLPGQTKRKLRRSRCEL